MFHSGKLNNECLIHYNTPMDNHFFMPPKQEAARPEAIAEKGGCYTAYFERLKREEINRLLGVLQYLPRQGRAALVKMYLINSPFYFRA